MDGSDPFEAVLGMAGWGIRDTATGEFLVDAYDTAEDAWHAFFALESGDVVTEIDH